MQKQKNEVSNKDASKKERFLKKKGLIVLILLLLIFCGTMFGFYLKNNDLNSSIAGNSEITKNESTNGDETKESSESEEEVSTNDGGNSSTSKPNEVEQNGSNQGVNNSNKNDKPNANGNKPNVGTTPESGGSNSDGGNKPGNGGGNSGNGESNPGEGGDSGSGGSNPGEGGNSGSGNENPGTGEERPKFNVSILDIVALNKENREILYFEKGEEVKLLISVENTSGIDVNEFVINDNNYIASKKTDIFNLFKRKNISEKYEVLLPSGESSGVKEQKITSAISKDGQVIELNEIKEIEVLKDTPKASKFSAIYNEENNTEEISIYLEDEEKSLIKDKSYGVLYNENGIELLRKPLKSNENNEFSFDVEANEKFIFKVLVDYDLDSNILNHITGECNLYKEQVIFEDEIIVEKKLIEYKDITGAQVYKKSGDKVIPIDIIDISMPLDLSQYIIELNFKDMPALNLPIKSYEVERNKLQLIADTQNVVQYDADGNRRLEFRIDYTSTNNGNVDIQTIQGLKKAIMENPSGTFELHRDLDASINRDGEAIIPVEFTGVLNGNGYKIINSKLPLFKSINGGNINSIIFEKPSLLLPNVDKVGVVAKEGTSANIKDLHITGGNISAARNVGGILGRDSGSNIYESSANVNISVTAGNAGAIVGYKSNGGEIVNSYAIGEINTTVSGAGEKVGGLVGQMPSGKIKNSYANVDVTSKNTSGTQVGGLIGSTYSGGNSENNISFGNVINGMKLDGDRNYLGRHRNTYEYENSKGTSVNSLTPIPTNILIAREEDKNNSSFYSVNLTWDTDTIWDVTKVSKGEYPSLKNSDPRGNNVVKKDTKLPRLKALVDEAQSDKEGNIYIPNLSQLSKLDNFDNNRRIAYHNIYKLMPYYEGKYIIEFGNKIPVDHELNTKVIKDVLPLNSKGVQTSIANNNFKDITKIMVMFKDGSINKYDVYDAIFKKQNSIAEYKISGLDIIYNPNSYVTKEDESAIGELSNIINGLSFDDVLSVVGGRYLEENKVELHDGQYWNKYPLDFYLLDESYEKIKGNINGFITSLMTADDKLNITSNNEVINLKVKGQIEEKLKLYLFSNSYISRWYDISVGDINLKDLIYIYPEIYNENANINDIVNAFSGIDTTNRNILKSNETHNFYKSKLAGILGKTEVADFIEESVRYFDGTENVSDWFSKNFGGYLAERSIKEQPNAEYRAWDLVKSNKQAKGNFILPALTYKGGDLYIISTPGTIVFGGLSNYSAYYEEGKGPEFVKGLVDRFANRLEEYYSTISRINERSGELLKNTKHVVWDNMGHSKGVSGWADARDPNFSAMHYFYAANRMVYSGNSGAAGVANGYWSWYPHCKVLDSDYSYSVWSHENAHNQDGGLIMDGYGRRSGLGAEDYATGMFEHDAKGDTFSINFALDYSKSDVVYANRSPQRFQNVDDLNEFYNGMVNTVYVMDIIEAEIILDMTPEEQSKVIMQLNYGKPGEAVDKRYTRYDNLTPEQITQMNLKTIDDLVDNRIITRMPNTVINPNNYGASSLSKAVYYQAYNESGRTDNVSEKRMAYEVLGHKGWKDGLIEFYSNKSGYKDDLQALRGIYNDSNLTFEDWKKGRFNEVNNELKTSSLSVISEDIIKDVFKKAFIQDLQNGNTNAMTNARRQVYLMIKEGTQEFNSSIFGDVNVSSIPISTANEFVNKISENPNAQYYLTSNLDFSGVIPKEETAYIEHTFKGVLNGNGYKITGTTLPLFKEVRNSFIDSLIIEGANINLSEVASVGALARDSYNLYIKDVHVNNSTIKGNERVGGLIGFDRENGTIIQSSFNGVVESVKSFAGGIAGAKYYGSVESSYTSGKISGGGQYIGGFIGDNRSSINNSYSAADVKGNGATGTFVGVHENANSGMLTNSLAVGNTNRYVFLERSNLDKLLNNYQYEKSNGNSHIGKSEYIGKINEASYNDLFNEDFYRDILGWDTTNVWDVSNVQNGELPTLKSALDNNNNITLESNISTSEELIEKLSSNPFGNYKLTANIDLNSYKDGESVITTEFLGSLNGNEKTITGLSIPLFKKVNNATIENLIINGAYIDKAEENVGILSKQGSNSKISNVSITNSTVIGLKKV